MKTARNSEQFISEADLYEITIPLTPRLNAEGDKAVYILRKADKESGRFHTRLHLLDIRRKHDTEYTRGNADSHPCWHPGGKKILYLNNDNKDNTLRSISIHGGESTDVMKLGKGDVQSIAWSPDGKWIAILMKKPETDGADSDTEPKEPVLRVIDRLYTRHDGKGWDMDARASLYLLKTGSATVQKIADSPLSHISDFAWSSDSQRIAYVMNAHPDPDRNAGHDSIFIYSLTDKSTVELPKQPGPVSRLRFGNADRSIFFTGHFHPENLWGTFNSEFFELDIEDGNCRSLSEDLDRTLSAASLGDISPMDTDQTPVCDPDGTWYFTITSEGGSPLIRRSPSGDTEAILEGPEVIAEYDKAQNAPVFILRLAQMERPDELWLLRLDEEKTLTKITDLNDRYLSNRQYTFPEVHTIPVDGAEIQTWIVKPPQFREKSKWPMILEIHGGPHSQYAYTFFHEMQVLAAAGFVVVYANPRGSQGYGRDFAKAIHGSWAEPAFSDLMTVTDYMAETGYIDEERLFVTGGSYGGYMTNWIVTQTDRFRAAATQRSVTNLETFFGCSDMGWELSSEFNGAPWENPEIYRKWSPITHAAQIRTPLLIIHSENDLRCPIEQAEQLFVRLKYEGRPVKFLRFPEESHGLSRNGRIDRRIARLQALRDWFHSCL